MTRAIRTTAIVQQGGIVQIVSSELGEGTSVEVIVLAEDGPNKPSVNELLAGKRGGILYTTPEQVDAAIREERDSWEH